MKKGYLLEKDGGGGHLSFTANTSEYGYCNVVKLFYSKISSSWTSLVKGKRAIKVSQDGNGNYSIELKGKKPILVDICELDYIYEAVRVIKKMDKKTFCSYTYLERK